MRQFDFVSAYRTTGVVSVRVFPTERPVGQAGYKTDADDVWRLVEDGLILDATFQS